MPKPRPSLPGADVLFSRRLPKTATAPETEIQTHRVPKTPKYRLMEQHNFQVWPEQIDFLAHLERTIMRSRSREHRKERITKSTIVRALLRWLEQHARAINWQNIPDEETLIQRLDESITSPETR